MMNIAHILKEKSRQSGAPLWVVEKDYSLSYLLAGIAGVSELDNRVVLKGGTALRKAFFKDYRFSEDLDYSTLRLDPLPDVDSIMEAAVKKTEDLLQERGAFQVEYNRLRLREAHPGDQAAFTVRIQFPYQRSALCRLKVEFTVDEHVIHSPELRPILHDFQESFETSVMVYPLAEIVAEKLRALLQSRQRLHARGWGASRVCRDYYDLWKVLDLTGLPGADIQGLTIQKCENRGVAVLSPEAFFAPELIEVAQTEWDRQLKPFVSHCPDAITVLNTLREAVLGFWS